MTKDKAVNSQQSIHEAASSSIRDDASISSILEEVKITYILEILSYILIFETSVMHLEGKRRWGLHHPRIYNTPFNLMLARGKSLVNFLTFKLAWLDLVLSPRSFKTSSAIFTTGKM